MKAEGTQQSVESITPLPSPSFQERDMKIDVEITLIYQKKIEMAIRLHFGWYIICVSGWRGMDKVEKMDCRANGEVTFCAMSLLLSQSSKISSPSSQRIESSLNVKRNELSRQEYRKNDNGKQLLTNSYQKKKQNMLRIAPTSH
jgi:hypothetical protein